MRPHPNSLAKATSPFARVNAARDNELMELRDQGWTYRALARRYGLSVSGIECVIRRESRRQIYPSVLGLSTRASNGLRFGFDCLWEGTAQISPADVAAVPYKEIIKLPNIGKGSILEIALMLRRHGLKMKGLPPTLEGALRNLE